MKVKVIISTILFSLVWTLLASLVIIPGILPKDGERCAKLKGGYEDCRPFSYSKLDDLYKLSKDILDVVSAHTVVGSGAGLLGGLLMSILNNKFNPSG